MKCENFQIQQIRGSLNLRKKITSTLRKACDKIEAAQISQKHFADMKRKHTEFKVGDTVYVDSSVFRHPGAKFSKYYRFGPYPIVEVVTPLKYKFKLEPKFSNMHPVFHVEKLRLQPPPSEICADPEIQVAEVLGTYVDKYIPLRRNKSKT